MAQKVNIKYSCDKKWQSMTPLKDNIRHCDNCNERIRDFSKDGSVDTKNISCGRFSLGQVGKIHSQLTFNSLATLTMSVVGLLNLTSDPVSAQTTGNVTTKHVEKINAGLIKISGVVKDKKSNQPIAFTNVVLLSSGKTVTGCTTNFDGEFAMNSIDTTTFPLDELQLIISCVGYANDTISAINIPEEFIGMDLVVDMATVTEFTHPIIETYTTTGLIAIEPDTTKKK